MRKTVKAASAILAAVLFAAVGTGCKDTKYSAYDSSGERYDYYLPDYIKAGSYEGIELPDLTYTPTEDEVSDFMMSLESQYAPRTLADDRPCQKGDIVSISSECTFKESGDTYSLYQFRENAKGQGYFFTLGVGDLLFPELDEAIIGMNKGETKEVTLTLPDPFYKDYTNSGKELNMKIKLLTVENIDYSVANDEFYAEHFEYASKEAYTEVAKNKLAADRNKMIDGYQTDMAWKYFVDSSELIKVPEDEYNEIYNGLVDSARSNAQSKDLSLLEYVQSELGFDTLDDYYADIKEFAENSCFEEMLLYYVIRCENLNYDDSFYDAQLLERCEDYQITDAAEAEDFLDYYYGIKQVREDIRFEYAKKWISERATVNEDLHTVNK